MGMERGLGDSTDGLALAGSLEATLYEVKRTSATGVDDLRAVARLWAEIAAELSGFSVTHPMEWLGERSRRWLRCR